MESESGILFDPDDNLVRIWKKPVPNATTQMRWGSSASPPQPEKYTCSLEVFGCLWIYDEQGLHLIEKNKSDAQTIESSDHLDSAVRKTDASLEEWLKHWNFWKTDYKRSLGENVFAFRKEEYNSRAWSSVCFVERACIKLGVSVPAWPPKCNLDLYSNRHKFNIITKDNAFPVKVWRTSTIQIFGIPLHTILNRLNLMDSIICPPGAYHGYLEVYGKIWEYGPQGMACVLPECSSQRKQAILMYTGYTCLTLDDWMKEWLHFEDKTSFRSTANAYSLFEVNCLTFLTYALNALGVERPKEIQGLTRWMRQFVWHGKQLRVPGVGVELFIPPLAWVIKIIRPCCIAVLAIVPYYAVKSHYIGSKTI